MKRKIIILVFIIACITHFAALYYLGISFFTTTVLFYLVLYYLIIKISFYLTNEESTQKIIRFNLKAIIIIFLITEFSCTFIFKYLNNYIENKTGFYFSLYMRDRQVDFFHALGKMRARNDWSQGYEPHITHLHQSKDFNYSVTFNELGLRGKLPPVEKDSNEFRILVLGDSFIEGFGAHENETFPVQLHSTLQKKTASKVSVINAGICGSNPWYEIHLYENKLKKLNPDLVLMEINLTDVEDFDQAKNQGNMPVSEYFKAISHIYRIIDKILNLSFTDYRTSKHEAVISDAVLSEIKSFNAVLLQEEKDLLIIYLASRIEVHSSTKSTLLQALQRSQLPYINLQDKYHVVMPEKYEDLDKYYWENDGHHNPTGYHLMAEIIANELVKRKYLH